MYDPARFAGPAIEGYLYQFDKTILEILHASSSETITAEYLEDIGITKGNAETCIQCKYYPAQTLTSSSLREPIFEMLKSHRTYSSRKLKFQLFIHSQGKGPRFQVPKTVDDIKVLLTHTKGSGADRITIEDHVNEGISDIEIADFLKAFCLVEGPSREDQRTDIFDNLKKAFSCTAEEAEFLYYGNALRKVIDLSINSDPKNRMITRTDFKRDISVKDYFFGIWQLASSSTIKFRGQVRKRIKKLEFYVPSRDRTILLSHDYFEHLDINALARTIKDIAQNHYTIGKSLYDAIPLTFVLDGSTTQVTEVKKALLGLRVKIFDGFETIAFQVDQFLEIPIINKKTSVRGRSSDIISAAGFTVRIVSAETYRDKLTEHHTPDTVVVFGDFSYSNAFNSKCTDTIFVPPIDYHEMKQILVRS